MRTIGTVIAATIADLNGYLDQLAGDEYRSGRAGQPAQPQPGMPAAYGELWLIAVNQPTVSNSNTWLVIAFTSNEDIPGWPSHAGDYTGGIRTAEDIARPLAAAGHTVVLRHYQDFAVASTAADVPLT